MRLSICLTFGCALLCAACGTDPGNGDGPDNHLDGGGGSKDMAVPTSFTFKTEAIPGCVQGGTQTVVSVVGNKFALATLDITTKTTTCTLPMRSPQEVPDYDICYAESVGGAPFTASVVLTENQPSVLGVGMALDPSGKPSIAFTGGDPAAERCGGTDLLFAAAGNWGAPQTVATGSQSGSLDPSQATDCIQNVCNSGDATGFWPAVAFSPSGVPAIAWRDLHFGFAMDDYAAADVEFGMGPGFSDLTVDVSHGAGTYMRLAFTPGGQPAIVSYNGEGTLPMVNGVWINHQLPSGTWERKQINRAAIGEQIGFSVGPSGLHSLAYYDPKLEKLEYQESNDGTNWSAAMDVDTDGVTGLNPTLAFDGNGQPAIAYYRCNDYVPNNQSCDNNKDGLMIARRFNGRWKVYPVSKVSGVQDGLYPALGFVDGKAVIAFQIRAYDQGAMKSTLTLNVAREQ